MKVGFWMFTSCCTWWAIMDSYHRHESFWLALFVAGYAMLCLGFAELARLDNLLRD